MLVRDLVLSYFLKFWEDIFFLMNLFSYNNFGSHYTGKYLLENEFDKINLIYILKEG